MIEFQAFSDVVEYILLNTSDCKFTILKDLLSWLIIILIM